MSRWFRLYDDVINDPKLLKLPEALRWAWVGMLCVASKNGGCLPPVDDVALMLRVPEAKAAEYITKLVKAELIDQVDGVFSPHNWDGRQFKSDTSNERVKKHRDAKRNVTPKQDCNVTRSVTSTVTETGPEAEAETEADSEQSRADAGALLNEDSGRKTLALQTSVALAFSTRGMPVPALERCALWLQQGYGQGVVLGAVDRVLKRGRAISTLDYFDAAIREDHAKPGAPAPSLQVVASGVWVDEGTQEWDCHQSESFRLTRKGTPVTDQKDENGRLTGRRGWFFKSRWPEGFNDFGERMAPDNAEENAA